MDESELDRTPNPFSAFAKTRDQSRRNFASTVKLLLLAIVMFALVTGGQIAFQRAKLAGLLIGFENQTTSQKMDRLGDLKATGAQGIKGLVAALVDEQENVSASAAGHLAELNRQWLTMPSEQADAQRHVFAESLCGIASTVDDRSGSRWARIYSLAQRTAQDLIANNVSVDDETYKMVMTIVAPGAAQTNQPAAARDQATGTLASSIPLPIEAVDDAGAAWTDWPPTSTKPSILRSSVATINSIDAKDVLLTQSTDAATTETSEPRILRPSYRAATSLGEGYQQRRRSEDYSTADWISQLESSSRYVRKSAVIELIRRNEPSATSALKSHLTVETDHEIRQLMQRTEEP